MLKYDFYRGLYLPSNSTIVIFLLRNLYIRFQGHTFSCYAFDIKKLRNPRVSPEDLPRLARPRREVDLV